MIFIDDKNSLKNVELDKAQNIRYIKKVIDVSTSTGSFPLYVEASEPITKEVKKLSAFEEVEEC